MTALTRRAVVTTGLAMPFVARAESGPGVLIVGGGFGGATLLGRSAASIRISK